jgi:hypothetical protein
MVFLFYRLWIARRDLLQACLAERDLSRQRLALLNSYIKFYLVSYKLFVVLITISFFLVFSLLLRNQDKQKLLWQKRQMAGHSQRHLLHLRLKMLR